MTFKERTDIWILFESRALSNADSSRQSPGNPTRPDVRRSDSDNPHPRYIAVDKADILESYVIFPTLDSNELTTCFTADQYLNINRGGMVVWSGNWD